MFTKSLILFILSCGNNKNTVDNKQNRDNKKDLLSSLFIYQNRENGEFKELKPNSTFNQNIRITFNKENKKYKEANNKDDNINSGLYFIIFKILDNNEKESITTLKTRNDYTEVVLNENGRYLIYAVNRYHAHIMQETEGYEEDPKIEIKINKDEDNKVPISFEIEGKLVKNIPLISISSEIKIVKNQDYDGIKSIRVIVNLENIEDKDFPKLISLERNFLSKNEIIINWLEQFEEEEFVLPKRKNLITYFQGKELLIEGEFAGKETKKRFLFSNSLREIKLNKEFKINYLNFNLKGNLEVIDRHLDEDKWEYIDKEIFRGEISNSKRLKIDENYNNIILKIDNLEEVSIMKLELEHNIELSINGKTLIGYDIIKEEEILPNSELIIKEKDNKDLGDFYLKQKSLSYSYNGKEVDLKFERENDIYKVNLFEVLKNIKENSKEKICILEIEGLENSEIIIELKQ